MFRAPLCSSSGESIVLIRHLVYVTLCRWPSSVQVWMELSSNQTCTLNGHLHRVTCSRFRINTIDSPDDEHRCSKHVENWNKCIRKKELCVNLDKNWTVMHGQQNIKYKLCLHIRSHFKYNLLQNTKSSQFFLRGHFWNKEQTIFFILVGSVSVAQTKTQRRVVNWNIERSEKKNTSAF